MPSPTQPTAADTLIAHVSEDGREVLDPVDFDEVVAVFKALGHPVRLDIIRRMLHVPELACTELEQTLPIAKSTISYHIKLLYRARLIDVRRDGRYYHYTPRWDEVNRLVPGLVTLLQERLR